MTGRAAQLAETIQMVVLDVDGVLTDGSVLYSGPDQTEIKAFNIKDGLGIKLLRDSRIEVAIITGRKSEAVTQRMDELGVDIVLQGREDKREALLEILATRDIPLAQVAHIGDLPQRRGVGRSCHSRLGRSPPRRPWRRASAQRLYSSRSGKKRSAAS